MNEPYYRVFRFSLDAVVIVKTDFFLSLQERFRNDV